MFNLLLRQQNLPETGKNPNTYGSRKNKIILNKIKTTLPELMSRNLMLGERLKNKIIVSSFMNNTENKNQKYLNYFVISSGKRVKDVKTGLGLKRVIKKGINYLSPVCQNISNDIIIKNGDFLIKEKKLINEKTEQETHTKINELIKGIKHIIKPLKIIKKQPTHKIVKSMSEQELYKIKYYINNEFNDDQKRLKNKINFYINKLNTVAATKPKEFRKIASNIYLNSNLKMINYSKPKIIQMKDTESSNLLRIRKHLVQTITNSKKNKRGDVDDSLTEDKFKNYINIVYKKPSMSKINNSNDTLNVLKNLAYQNKFLEKKAKKNLNAINSLIDIKLPYCSNYSRTIKYCKDGQNIKNKNLSMDNYYDNSGNELIDMGFDEDNMIDEIKLIKEEINDITDKKIIESCNHIQNLKNQLKV